MQEIKIELTSSQFRNNIDLINILSPAFLMKAGDLLILIIHFPNDGKFIHSENLLIISSLVAHVRNKNSFVEVAIEGVNDYASRINFYKILGIPNEEKFIRRSSTGKFIELKNFNQDTIYGIQDELNMILYQNRGIAKEVLQLLFYCLNEVMDNILLHSGENVGWVSAQYFAKSNEISVPPLAQVCRVDKSDGYLCHTCKNPR